MTNEIDLHDILEQDKKTIAEVKKKAKPVNKGILGLAVAMTAMFVILLWQNSNLSTVLSRRSPFMEYTICYNERDSAERKSYNDLLNLYVGTEGPTPEVLVVKRKAYNDAALLLSEATDLDSPNRCPGLEVLKDR